MNQSLSDDAAVLTRERVTIVDQLIDQDRLKEVTRQGLTIGAHETSDGDLCLMEALAYVLGIPHTDHPECVSPILGQFGRQINDVLPDELRQDLIPLIHLLPGTADDGLDVTRGYLALDWLVRTWLPAWLDLVPECHEDAARIHGLDPIVDLASASSAGPVVRSCRTRATDAAGVAAWGAGPAAWNAAQNAAQNAALGAALDAAQDAAWGAGSAVWDAAQNAALGAALDAALDAAQDAARDAALGAVWDAAQGGAGAALQPTVVTLRKSAIELFTMMATVSPASHTDL